MSNGKSIYWLFQLIGWGSFAAINMFFAFFFERMADAPSRQLAIARLSLFILSGLAATHLMRSVIQRLNVVKKSLDKQFAYFFFLSVVFSVLPGTLYAMGCLRWEMLGEGDAAFAGRPLLLILRGSFYFFLNTVIWNLVYFVSHFVSASRRQQQDVWRLEEMMKEMTLDNYQFQPEQK
ncbi:hypothetical protein LZZ85_08945 [Terrimonas sp. NA20]|uniref:Uncharacterized protein n=1 Tax=Terrimonas ginsenosidimutans TaxID=2908004 RepID=A0ABS9KQ07_9BACT|nr:hypothetical protein [Terrimonas ginsenosidimutans]MCG2614405.1 hypothetical protein [Terrimonas ginsenosidimutans]